MFNINSSHLEGGKAIFLLFKIHFYTKILILNLLLDLVNCSTFQQLAKRKERASYLTFGNQQKTILQTWACVCICKKFKNAFFYSHSNHA